MSTIIRSTDRGRGIQPEAFNFEDLATQANRYLDKIRSQGAEFLTEARQEAETIRKRAESEGRTTGQKAVEQMVSQQLAQQLTTLMPALQQAVQGIRDAKQAWLKHWEKSAVAVAVAIAHRVVRRELAQNPDISLGWLREALELAAGSAQLRIHLNPADCQTLGKQAALLAREMGSVANPEVVPDPAVSPGGCRVETRFGSIDQQLESQLARIEEELT